MKWFTNDANVPSTLEITPAAFRACGADVKMLIESEVLRCGDVSFFSAKQRASQTKETKEARHIQRMRDF